MFEGIVYDDREPDKVIERFTGKTHEDVFDQVKRELDMFVDPDDGVRPLHLTYKIYEVEDKNVQGNSL